ncbi:MAG: ABC transporter ATP-binding protein [Oscillospiraceae bacterium]|nr:ABC transporter ATP-binding protein [Oscillospiraceae bacterium]
MLKIENLVVSYGGIEALKGISINVDKGQIVTLVGANGAGKSTTLRTIAGLVKPLRGSITFEGKSLLNVSTHEIVQKGISLVPEGRRIFPDLTVLENLKMGAFFRKDAEEIKKDMDWVYELFPILKQRSWQLGGTLSGGEQQMLAVGRGLMSRPRLMMMDEPSLGLAPMIVKNIFEIIKKINSEGITILLVEQNANVALHIANIGYVLETGSIKLSGPGKELLVNEEVKKAYLGESVGAK